MRIMFITEFLPPRVSGIAERCKQYIDGYKRKGHYVSTWSVEGTEGSDHVMPSIINFTNHDQRLALISLSLLWSILTEPWDIIHLVTPGVVNTWFILLVAKLRGIKVYVSYHVNMKKYAVAYFGPYLGVFLITLFQIFYHTYIALMCDVIGFPSRAPLEDFLVLPKRVHIMSCGVDLEKYYPLQKEERESVKEKVQLSTYNEKKSYKRIVYVGRLAPEKSCEFIIELFAKYSTEFHNYELVFVGDGPQRKVLEQKIKQLDESISSRIHLLGMLHNKDLVLQYQIADLFITASETETFGFTNAESLSCGTPVVCVKAGAFPESYKILLDNGYMFNSKDFKACFDMCVSAVNLGESLRIESRKMAENHYSWDYTVNDMIREYNYISNRCKHV